MRQPRLDPGLLEGEDLERWYLRPSHQVEAERELARNERYEAFFGLSNKDASSEGSAKDEFAYAPQGESVGWQEAMYRPPAAGSATGVPPRPGGVRVGSPAPAAGTPSHPPRGGFFETHAVVPNPAFGPVYVTDLPSPMNSVKPRPGGWFELGDGSLVKGVDEVERIYAEQQRRRRGEEDSEPAAQVRTGDRYKDGVIPRADQLQNGEREKDATCHPYGGWERDPGFSSSPERSRRYETQINRAPGLDYVVRNPGDRPVKFDGCAVWDPRRQLLEAKGPGYGGLVGWPSRVKVETPKQARRQAAASGGRTVEWHVAEPQAVPYFASVLEPYPSLRLQQTPAR